MKQVKGLVASLHHIIHHHARTAAWSTCVHLHAGACVCTRRRNGKRVRLALCLALKAVQRSAPACRMLQPTCPPAPRRQARSPSQWVSAPRQTDPIKPTHTSCPAAIPAVVSASGATATHACVAGSRGAEPSTRHPARSGGGPFVAAISSQFRSSTNQTSFDAPRFKKLLSRPCTRQHTVAIGTHRSRHPVPHRTAPL